MLAFFLIIALLMTYDYITGFFFSISILISSTWIAFEINYLHFSHTSVRTCTAASNL